MGKEYGRYGDACHYLCGNRVSLKAGKKNSHAEQKVEEQKSKEPDSTEQMELQMGG